MSTFTSDSRGGLWTRLNFNVAPLTTINTDKILFSELKSLEYIVTIYNESQSKFRSFYLRANSKNGDVVDSIYGKIGDSINVNVNTKKVLNDFVLEIVNNESFGLDIRLSRLKH